jgi:Rrf2 family transcriptional regulator, iron-sulfur cluster assembly transcription factor
MSFIILFYLPLILKLGIMFSKACEYGIKASLFIATESQQGKRVSLTDIAKEINSPTAFTAKVLQQLAKSKIIKSAKGPSGGFEISESGMENIKLSHIVSAIDGDSVFNGCALGFLNCNENKPCPVHNKFKKIRNDLKAMLEKTSLMDLSGDINNGLTFLRQ